MVSTTGFGLLPDEVAFVGRGDADQPIDRAHDLGVARARFPRMSSIGLGRLDQALRRVVTSAIGVVERTLWLSASISTSGRTRLSRLSARTCCAWPARACLRPRGAWPRTALGRSCRAAHPWRSGGPSWKWISSIVPCTRARIGMSREPAVSPIDSRNTGTSRWVTATTGTSGGGGAGGVGGSPHPEVVSRVRTTPNRTAVFMELGRSDDSSRLVNEVEARSSRIQQRGMNRSGRDWARNCAGAKMPRPIPLRTSPIR